MDPSLSTSSRVRAPVGSGTRRAKVSCWPEMPGCVNADRSSEESPSTPASSRAPVRPHALVRLVLLVVVHVVQIVRDARRASRRRAEETQQSQQARGREEDAAARTEVGRKSFENRKRPEVHRISRFRAKTKARSKSSAERAIAESRNRAETQTAQETACADCVPRSARGARFRPSISLRRPFSRVPRNASARAKRVVARHPTARRTSPARPALRPPTPASLDARPPRDTDHRAVRARSRPFRSRHPRVTDTDEALSRGRCRRLLLESPGRHRPLPPRPSPIPCVSRANPTPRSALSPTLGILP